METGRLRVWHNSLIVTPWLRELSSSRILSVVVGPGVGLMIRITGNGVAQNSFYLILRLLNH